MSNINHKGATMSSPFNPVANPLVLMSEFGLVLYQEGQQFVLVSVEGEAFFSTVEEAFNHYCRLSSDSQLVFDDNGKSRTKKSSLMSRLWTPLVSPLTGMRSAMILVK